MSNRKPRPKVDFEKREIDVALTIYFKEMGKAARFAAKLIKKPPKGVVKI